MKFLFSLFCAIHYFICARHDEGTGWLSAGKTAVSRIQLILNKRNRSSKSFSVSGSFEVVESGSVSPSFPLLAMLWHQ